MSDVVEIKDVGVAFKLLNYQFKELGLWDDGVLDVSGLRKDPGTEKTPQEQRRQAIIAFTQEVQGKDSGATSHEVFENLSVDIDPERFRNEWSALVEGVLCTRLVMVNSALRKELMSDARVVRGARPRTGDVFLRGCSVGDRLYSRSG